MLALSLLCLIMTLYIITSPIVHCFWLTGHAMPMNLSNHACRKICVDKKPGVHSMVSWSWPLISSGWTEVELEMELTPFHLRWKVYGSGTRDGEQSQNVEHEYGSRDGFNPPSSKVRHIWDWNWRWSGPSKSTAQIWIQRWSWPP